jgi:ferrous iron transport protein A
MKLSSMKPGQKGVVVGFDDTDKKYRRKLLRMGILKGTPFAFVRKAPLGDPIEIQVQDCFVSLRKEEAAIVNVEVE